MTDSAQLREQAHTILQSGRFHARKTPAPFRGALRTVGGWLQPVLRPLRHLLEILASWWGETIPRLVLIVIVLSLATLLSLLVIRRRTARAIATSHWRGDGRESDDPVELERAADRAEQAGNYSTALRLRFRAGVIRLQADGRVRRGRTTTTRAIGRQLRSTSFDGLGRTFDAVAYGGRAATIEDARVARESWDHVLHEKAS